MEAQAEAALVFLLVRREGGGVRGAGACVSGRVVL
jgi:hypothetical protein